MFRLNVRLAFRHALVAAALSFSLWCQASIILLEPFDYPDGPLVGSARGRWETHSGKTNELDVLSGEAQLVQSRSEDAGAPLTGRPYLEDHPVGAIYVKFQFRFVAVPTAAGGGYFAHFKDDAGGFRGRVWAVTNGASAGSARLGISSGGTTPSSILARDLSPGGNHTVLVRYELATARTTLWIDPTSESDVSASSVDKNTPISVERFALRQNSGIGRISIDRIVVATSFAEALSGVVVEPVLPEITTQPQDLEIEEGGTAEFRAAATRAASFQWTHDSIPLVNETNATLNLSNVIASQAGAYRVTAINPSGTVESRKATLIVHPVVRVERMRIIELRGRVQPPNFVPDSTESLMATEGVVTSAINLASPPDVLFFIQDDTAGIAVFWKGGATHQPPQFGDKVRVTGLLGHFNGLLQFVVDPVRRGTQVESLAAGQSVPVPMAIDFDAVLDIARMERIEGSRVAALSVRLDTTAAEFARGGNLTMTNLDGRTFVARLDSRLPEPPVKTKPRGPVNVIGLLSQFDSTNPRTNGYQLLVNRWEDIREVAPAPELRFTNEVRLIRLGDAPTNQFSELVLLPGERLTLRAWAVDPQSKPVFLWLDSRGMPATAQWITGKPESTGSSATLTYTPSTVDASKSMLFRLIASNGESTNSLELGVYVPSVLEQRVTIGEFLANPTLDPTSPLYNPLRRKVPLTKDASLDEFVEIVNGTEVTLDFAGWTVSDSARVRHRFVEPFTVGASNSAVIFGGPSRGAEFAVEIPLIPASEGGEGLGLNNSGGDMLLLRNPAGNLVCRVVYGSVPSTGSLSRFPDVYGAFTNQALISGFAATPGRQFSGRNYFDGPLGPARRARVEMERVPDGVMLRWEEEPGRSYTVERTTDLGSNFRSIAPGLYRGEYLDRGAIGRAGFYRVIIHDR